MDCTIENLNSCIFLVGGSLYITFNNNTGVVAMYSSSNCQGSSVNTTYTANTCATVSGGTSLTIFTGARLYSNTQYYPTQSSCASGAIFQSAFNLNITGFMCTTTNCTCTAFVCSRTTCGTTPVTCGISTGTVFTAAVYNTAGCTTGQTSFSCYGAGSCINTPTNTSLMVTCSGGSITGGGGYTTTGCTGNLTAGNFTAGCAPDGRGNYITATCGASSTSGTSGSSGTTSASTSTSNSNVITFSVCAVLSILSMMVLSLIL